MSESYKHVLAIDPGASTGWARMVGRTYAEGGVFSPMSKDQETFENRMARYASHLEAILIHKQPDIVLIEKPSNFMHSSRGGKKMSTNYAGRMEAMMKNAQAFTALFEAARRFQCRVVAVTPTEWKGKKTKAWSKGIATHLVGHTPANQDLCDAIALANWWSGSGSMKYADVVSETSWPNIISSDSIKRLPL